MTVSINSDVTILGSQLCEALGVQNPGISPFFVEASPNGKAQVTLGESKMQAGLTFNACHLVIAGKMNEMSKAVAASNFKVAIHTLLGNQPTPMGGDEDAKDCNSYTYDVDVSGIKEGSLSVMDAKPYVLSQLTLNPKNVVIAIKLLRMLCKCSAYESQNLVDLWKGEIKFEDKTFGSFFNDSKSPNIVKPKNPKSKTTLSAASSLGQPIKGTGGDSIYHCIAVGPRVNVAVRIRPNMQVSIRAEGADGNDIPQILREYMNEAGWAESSSGHFSLHLECKSKIMMRKTVGALLMSIGEEFTLVGSQFDSLIGVGH